MKNTINICFISLNAFHLFSNTGKDIGGAEVQLYYLAKKISQNSNFTVNFIIKDIKKNIIFNKIKVFGGIKKSFISKYFIFNLFKFINSLNKSHSDIYISRALGIETLLTAIYSKIKNKKYIYMVANQLDNPNNYEFKFYKKIIFTINIFLSDKIIIQNKEQYNFIKQKYFKKTILIKSIFPIKKNKYKKNKNFILWVSRCKKWKKPELFILIAKKFPQKKFIMICNKTKEKKYFYKIKKLAENENNLEFISFVPFKKIHFYYEKAELFINTSLFEGFPNTFLHSFQAKTPILSLNVNPDNIINEYKLGFFANGNLKKLLEKITILSKDKNKLKKIGENCYRYLENNHNLNKISKKYIDIFKKII